MKKIELDFIQGRMNTTPPKKIFINELAKLIPMKRITIRVI